MGWVQAAAAAAAAAGRGWSSRPCGGETRRRVHYPRGWLGGHGIEKGGPVNVVFRHPVSPPHGRRHERAATLIVD